jgi:hypothetical protein
MPSLPEMGTGPAVTMTQTSSLQGPHEEAWVPTMAVPFPGGSMVGGLSSLPCFWMGVGLLLIGVGVIVLLRQRGSE